MYVLLICKDKKITDLRVFVDILLHDIFRSINGLKQLGGFGLVSDIHLQQPRNAILLKSGASTQHTPYRELAPRNLLPYIYNILASYYNEFCADESSSDEDESGYESEHFKIGGKLFIRH